MSNESHKWVLGLGLLGMLVDTITPHPTLAVGKEVLHVASIPPNPYLAGFANERQWLFAHRHFKNRCVLEALAESKRLGGNLEVASQESNEGVAVPDLRLANNN
jgi:hypothetical protein